MEYKPIFLMDYEGSCLTYNGPIEDAIKYFVSNNEYWKIIVNGEVYLSRGSLCSFNEEGE